MKILKNPEIKRQLCYQIVLGAIVFAVTFFVDKKAASFCCLFLVLAFIIENIIQAKIRLNKIEKMCMDIDGILLGNRVELIKNCKEGELEILGTEINKVVRRTIIQTEKLQEEKVFLADSMADISHQLKTPLTSIHLILEFLKEKEISYIKRREYTQELEMLTKRIDWMVYALLKISKLDAGTIEFHKKEILAKELIENAYDSLAIPFDIRNISFELKSSGKETVYGDKVWLSEAISNILKNCMEHTAQGGKIFAEIKENLLYTIIEIKDDGVGFSEEDLPHIFERFYRGKNSDSNSVGIGLALSKAIISSHEGNISARNRKSGGACFSIRFYKSIV